MLTALRKHTKMIMAIVIGFFVVSIFAGYGMYSRSGRNNDGQRDYAAAKIDGKTVMRSALDNAMMRILEQMQHSSELSSADILSARKTALDSMVVQMELEKEARNRKIEVTKAEIDDAYNHVMSQYPTREAFFQYLQQINVTEQQVKDDIKNQLTQQKVIAELTGDVQVPEEEAQQYYDLTKGFLFHHPEGHKLNIATFSNHAAAENARKVVAGGADWDATMKAVGSVDLRGYTPFESPQVVPENLMTGPLEVLKGLGVGKVSSVIEVTSEDFSFALNRGKESERTLPYAEVSADVHALLRQQKQQQRQGQVFNELASRAKVEILDATIFPAPAQSLPLVGSTDQAPVSGDAKQ